MEWVQKTQRQKTQLTKDPIDKRPKRQKTHQDKRPNWQKTQWQKTQRQKTHGTKDPPGQKTQWTKDPPWQKTQFPRKKRPNSTSWIQQQTKNPQTKISKICQKLRENYAILKDFLLLYGWHQNVISRSFRRWRRRRRLSIPRKGTRCLLTTNHLSTLKRMKKLELLIGYAEGRSFWGYNARI